MTNPRTIMFRVLQKYVIGKRKPDFYVGPENDPSLERWRVISNKLFGVYVHRMRRDDPDDYPHDHPWSSLSWLLEGNYKEEINGKVVLRKPGSIVFRNAATPHRILVDLPQSNVPVTLFFVGRKKRNWSFVEK